MKGAGIGKVISPAIWRGVKMHSLTSKCTEMCSLIENALLNLLKCTLILLNHLNKQCWGSLYTCKAVYGICDLHKYAELDQ